MKKQMQKGFSLVELMVVIAIIAILAAVAIPMYSNYTTRAKISNEISKIGGAKADVAEQIADSNITALGAITGLSASAPSSIPANAAVDSDTGAITINVGNTTPDNTEALDSPIIADAAFLTLTPELISGAVKWTCANGSGSTINSSQLPSECRS